MSAEERRRTAGSSLPQQPGKAVLRLSCLLSVWGTTLISSCRGYTHDRDYLAYKKKPVGRAAGRNRAWPLGRKALPSSPEFAEQWFGKGAHRRAWSTRALATEKRRRMIRSSDHLSWAAEDTSSEWPSFTSAVCALQCIAYVDALADFCTRS